MIRRSDIDREFKDRGIARGGLVLYRPLDAIGIIRRCREAGLSLLGMDAFVVGPDWVQPSMEHSTDYSRAQNQIENPWAHAEDLLRQAGADALLFEVVTGDPPA